MFFPWPFLLQLWLTSLLITVVFSRFHWFFNLDEHVICEIRLFLSCHSQSGIFFWLFYWPGHAGPLWYWIEMAREDAVPYVWSWGESNLSPVSVMFVIGFLSMFLSSWESYPQFLVFFDQICMYDFAKGFSAFNIEIININ